MRFPAQASLTPQPTPCWKYLKAVWVRQDEAEAERRLAEAKRPTPLPASSKQALDSLDSDEDGSISEVRPGAKSPDYTAHQAPAGMVLAGSAGHLFASVFVMHQEHVAACSLPCALCRTRRVEVGGPSQQVQKRRHVVLSDDEDN